MNSVQSANDLLDKRGSSYSDRPSFAVLEAYFSLSIFPICTLIDTFSLGFTPNIAFMNDDAQFRKVRKAYGNLLSARSCLDYRDIQTKHAAVMASDIEKCPEKWLTYLSQYASLEELFYSTMTDNSSDSLPESSLVWLSPLISRTRKTIISTLQMRREKSLAIWVTIP